MKMVKLILASTIILTTSISSMFAQNISIGFRGGLYASKLATPDLSSSITQYAKPYASLDLGITSEIGITDNFSFQPEIAYVEKGFQVNEGLSTPIFGSSSALLGASVITKLRYIEMPLLAKLKFGDGAIRGYAIAGPTLGYAMNGDLITRATLLVNIKLNNIPLDLSTIGGQRFELGAMLGAGATFDIGKGKQLFADIRYARGFSDLNKIPAVDLNIKNQRLGLNVGMLFPIGG